MVLVRPLPLTSYYDAERELHTLGIDSFQINTHLGNLFHNALLVEGLAENLIKLIDNIIASSGAASVSGRAGKMVVAGTDAQLRSVAANLRQGTAAMSEIAQQMTELLNRKASPPGMWKVKTRVLDVGFRPHLMGILNVTPDSFSDGGRFSDVARAIDHALQLEADGADIIDIGGESTRPSSSPVEEKEELLRVVPVIERLAPQLKIPISVDTYKSRVAKEAVDAGAEIINDISGFAFDEAMAAVVADTGAGIVLMHTRGMPQEMQKNTSYDNIIAEIMMYLKAAANKASEAGVDRSCIVVDPGLGFGKDVSGNLQILRRLGEFKGLGYPVLVGSSRKNFIGKILERPMDERVLGTAATVAFAMMQGASIFRVHDVRQIRDVVDMVSAINNVDMQVLSTRELQ